MTPKTLALFGASMIGITACTQQPQEPIPPLLDLGSRSCATQPDGADAPLLSLTAEHGNVVKTVFDANTPCLRDAAGNISLYRTFLLPTSDIPATITVSSQPDRGTLLAPHILLLDGSGATTREIGMDSLMFRGGALTALVRTRSDERMLVVASTPATVGQSLDRLQSFVHQQVYVAYPVMVTVHTGSEAVSHIVLSHAGRVTVTVQPIPPAQVAH